MRENRIRVVALGWIQKDDRAFVFEFYDAGKQKTFYRSLGGGVEFGESSLDALQREFYEEIQAELTNIEYLGCIENRFQYLDRPMHEVIQLYRCDFRDRKFYELEELTFFDGSDQAITAKWVECDRFRSGELWLVPEACLSYL